MSKSPNQIAVEQLNRQLIPQINEQLVVQAEGFQAYKRLLSEADIHVTAEDQLRGYHQLCGSVPGVWVEGLLPQFYLTPTEGGYDLNVAEPDEDDEDAWCHPDCEFCVPRPPEDSLGFEPGAFACGAEKSGIECDQLSKAPFTPVPRFAVIFLDSDGQLRVHQATPLQ